MGSDTFLCNKTMFSRERKQLIYLEKGPSTFANIRPNLEG